MIPVSKYMDSGKNLFEAITSSYSIPMPRQVSETYPLAKAYAILRQHVLSAEPRLMKHRFTRHNPVIAWANKTPLEEQKEVAKQLGL